MYIESNEARNGEKKMTNQQIIDFDAIRGDCPNRFPLGTKFVRMGRKSKRVETVVDYISMINLAGEVVGGHYITEHDFCGQAVRDGSVAETTIARGDLVI